MPFENDPDYHPKKDEFYCTHIKHSPPGMILIPPGKQLRHTCPGCGKVTIVKSSQTLL